MSLEQLRGVLTKLPASVYRVKGIVYALEAPQRRAVLQVVGKRVDVALAGEWGSELPRTRIVAIGRHDVDLAAPQEAFAHC